MRVSNDIDWTDQIIDITETDDDQSIDENERYANQLVDVLLKGDPNFLKKIEKSGQTIEEFKEDLIQQIIIERQYFH